MVKRAIKIAEKQRDMTTRGCLFSAIICLTIMALILFGGLFLSSLYDKNYRANIDKNCLVIKGILVRKSAGSKGKSVSFSYSYKNNLFQNSEQGEKLYKELRIGDSVLIKIDTLNPSNSYLFVKTQTLVKH